MDADLNGLKRYLQTHKNNGAVEHNGKQLPRRIVIGIVNHGISLGYAKLSQITDEETDKIINEFKKKGSK